MLGVVIFACLPGGEVDSQTLWAGILILRGAMRPSAHANDDEIFNMVQIPNETYPDTSPSGIPYFLKNSFTFLGIFSALLVTGPIM